MPRSAPYLPCERNSLRTMVVGTHDGHGHGHGHDDERSPTMVSHAACRTAGDLLNAALRDDLASGNSHLWIIAHDRDHTIKGADDMHEHWLHITCSARLVTEPLWLRGWCT